MTTIVLYPRNQPESSYERPLSYLEALTTPIPIPILLPSETPVPSAKIQPGGHFYKFQWIWVS